MLWTVHWLNRRWCLRPHYHWDAWCLIQPLQNYLAKLGTGLFHRYLQKSNYLFQTNTCMFKENNKSTSKMHNDNYANLGGGGVLGVSNLPNDLRKFFHRLSTLTGFRLLFTNDQRGREPSLPSTFPDAWKSVDNRNLLMNEWWTYSPIQTDWKFQNEIKLWNKLKYAWIFPSLRHWVIRTLNVNSDIIFPLPIYRMNYLNVPCKHLHFM